MKRVLTLAFFLASSAECQRVVLDPPQPAAGQTVTIDYTPTGPPKSDADCHILVARVDFTFEILETSLKKAGEHFTGKFTLSVPGAAYCLMRIVFADGTTDDNDGNVWDFLVSGSDGKPLKGSRYLRGWYLANGKWNGFHHSVDYGAARSSLEEEKSAYPGSWLSDPILWDIQLKEHADPSVVGKEVDAYCLTYQGEDEAYGSMIQWKQKLGDTSAVESLRKKVFEKFPHGRSAFALRRDAVYMQKDGAERARLIENILRDFPDLAAAQKRNMKESLFYAFLRAKDYSKAATFLAAFETPSPGMYRAIADALISRKEQIDKAILWAKISVDSARHPSKPTFLTTKEWKEESEGDMEMSLSTYGSGLLLANRNEEASQILGEVYTLNKGDDPDVNDRYVDALVRVRRYSDALEIGKECVVSDKYSPSLVETMKSAFSEGGTFDSLPAEKKKQFDSMIAAALELKIAELRKKLLAGRLKKASVDFTLKDLSGNPVQLASLRGKVVVIDFWATWCGPCRSAFPYLQKVFDRYSGNRDVKFLAIDTWEREKDYAATVTNARKFLDDNKYSFPVIIDRTEDSKTASDYDVQGIPATFVVDKGGRIAYEGVGFEGPGMEDELIQKIEILLADRGGPME